MWRLQCSLPLAAIVLAASVVGVSEGKALSQGSALSKAIELLDALAAHITEESVGADKAYHEYFEWCDDTAATKQNEIKNLMIRKEKLEAIVSKSESDSESKDAIVSDLADKIREDSDELKGAQEIRAKESEEFKAAEAELMEADDTLTRAIDVLTKQMAKNPAAFAQVDTSSLNRILSSLSTVVDAAGLGADGKQKLLALAQSQQEESDEDDAPGSPDPAAYTSHSLGILDVLEDMQRKARSQLKDLRDTESNQKQNHELLQRSLEDTLDADKKKMTDEKSFSAETKEALSGAEKELVLQDKALDQVKNALKSLQDNCMRTASDHQASLEGRREELKVIAEAKKALQEAGADLLQQDAAPSFVQMGSRSQRVRLHVAQAIKNLAKESHSAALAQLASRIAAVAKYGASQDEDPFAKITNMVQQMIAKLETQAKAAAKEKAYCDEEMAKTEAKRDELQSDVSKISADIDTRVAKSTELKKDVVELEEMIAALQKEKMELEKVRADEHKAFLQVKSELETGLVGVKKALKILRKYYGNKEEDEALLQTGGEQPARPVMHKKSEGAGGSVMDILEVVEADLAQNLVEVEQEEEDEAKAVETRMLQINLELTGRGQDHKYKSQEYKGLDQEVNELSQTRQSTQEELDAVLQYYSKLRERCVAKPHAYEERKARRDSEIKGLKQALATMEEDVALLQRGRARGSLRAGGAALAP